MKKKSKNQVPRKRNEFRYHMVEYINSLGVKTKMAHPSFIFLEKGNLFMYVSLTHSKEIGNIPLIKLSKNPNNKDKSDSYLVLEFKEDTKDRFGSRRKGWKMDSNDEQFIRNIYQNWNKKR